MGENHARSHRDHGRWQDDTKEAAQRNRREARALTSAYAVMAGALEKNPETW